MVFPVDAIPDIVQISRDFRQPDAFFAFAERTQDFARPFADDPRMTAGMFGKADISGNINETP